MALVPLFCLFPDGRFVPRWTKWAVVPAMAGLTLKLDAARNLLRHDPEATDSLLFELKGQVQGAITDIRRLVYALRPPTLDELGLVSAIKERAKQYENHGLRITVEAPEPLPPVPAGGEVAAYRIAQEVLTNALAESLQPDVILMDIKMPGANGIEVTRRILQTSPHIGVLVVTMFEDDDSVFAAMRAGARGYLLKGADQEDILRAVRAMGDEVPELAEEC